MVEEVEEMVVLEEEVVDGKREQEEEREKREQEEETSCSGTSLNSLPTSTRGYGAWLPICALLWHWARGRPP